MNLETTTTEKMFFKKLDFHHVDDAEKKLNELEETPNSEEPRKMT